MERILNSFRRRNEVSDVQRLHMIINNAVAIARQFKRTFLRTQDFWFLKQDENLVAYQVIKQSLRREYENDRQFPMETVMLQSHNLKHGTNIENAIVHVGPYADELARSAHSAALTIGAHMFFRNGAYRPETEEGRKIRAHELEHVAQYEEGRTDHNADRETLEREAELAEGMEEYDDDPLHEVEINGKIFYLRDSEYPEVAADAKEMVEEWMDERRVILDEKEYINLLLRYKKLTGRRIL